MSSTAAQVAVHVLDNLTPGRVWSIQQQTISIHDHARSAVPALKGVVLDEGFLQGMELTVFGQSLNGRDRLARNGFYLEQARALGFAVHNHRAGPAKPFSAAVLCAGQAQVIPQNPEKNATGIDFKTHRLSVKRESYGLFHASTSIERRQSTTTASPP
jgi:hypothetical protein